MSGPEDFVARWSRLKRKSVKDKTRQAEAMSNAKAGDTGTTDADRASAPTPKADAATEPSFDLASLPSIDSITAGSDIRRFLQSGVPANLAVAALRRAWSSDPAIRDFIGLAENQWDFTDPTAMPGFGPLEATDNVSELVAQAMGKLPRGLPEVAEASSVEPSGEAGAFDFGRDSR